MFKKLVIIVLVLAVFALAFLPLITSSMADSAIETIHKKSSQEDLKKALELKLYIYLYGQARPYAEKAIILCPESDEIDFFIYTAAKCAEKEGKPKVAMHWYAKFIKLFDGTGHEWLQPAKNNYNKLKGLNE